MSGIDLDKAEQLIKLKEIKTRLTKELKNVSKSIKEVEEVLLDQFSASPINKISLFGKTLSVKRMLWAGIHKQHEDEDTKITYERACNMLKKMGLEDFVGERFMPQTLSGYVRELDKEGFPVPEQWEGIIKVAEKFTISVVNSGK